MKGKVTVTKTIYEEEFEGITGDEVRKIFSDLLQLYPKDYSCNLHTTIEAMDKEGNDNLPKGGKR